MSKERRRAERFSIQHLIELDYGKEQFVRASGINISSSGLLCQTEPAIELYTRVFLSLKLPSKNGEEIINCEGIVVRSDQDGSTFTTGISFTSFQPEEAEKLVRLLKYREGSADKPDANQR